MKKGIPFNWPPLVGGELDALRSVLERRELTGNGHFTQLCQQWIKDRLHVTEALLTHSCTGALEMAALLCNLVPGDEVIMPSFTFVSTANAVVLRGATPVFVDIRRDTLNLDENLIEAAITPRTKAIFVVHYAGVPCEMKKIMEIAKRHGLVVVEDAAQALLSEYEGKPAGSIGDAGCISFHATKNVVSGEGGAFVTSRPDFSEQAHVLWEKGTNRREFQDGRVDKYTWVDHGSSFLPSELIAAFLHVQLSSADRIIEDRLASWNAYHERFASLEQVGAIVRPTIPGNVTHNGHIYYILLPDVEERTRVIRELAARGINAVFHYVPLHDSPAGKKYTRVHGTLPVTEEMHARLVRMPLWTGIGDQVEIVAEAVHDIVRRT
ncbi:MAG: dTDP-4-amino-4,6-dideoxygalactose transaminase [Rhizobiales bacterium]|nr:dTDP-4-amino-4,6-dideoxygalactose transaminase [Hyphomicrobiales bacterium]